MRPTWPLLFLDLPTVAREHLPLVRRGAVAPRDAHEERVLARLLLVLDGPRRVGRAPRELRRDLALDRVVGVVGVAVELHADLHGNLGLRLETGLGAVLL